MHAFSSDYSSIGNVNPFPGIYAYMPFQYYRPLFNGNISSMVVNDRALNGAGNVGGPLMLYNYRYDQLNRLTRMDAANKPSVIYNNWGGLTLLQQFKEYMTYDGNGNILTLRRHGHKGAFLMDALTYSYYDNSNKLSRVYDPIPSNRYGSDAGDVPDIDLQAENNYQYNEIGNLIKDSAEGITNIKWSVYGKILEISRTPGGSNPVNKIVYTYDAQGNRISKVLHKSNGTISYTWYVRDAQGNTLATYQSSGSSISNLYELPLKLSERHLYGSSRLGIYSATVDVDNGPQNVSYVAAIKYIRGLKQYELTNHLGNVLATITDKKKGIDTNADGFIDYYDADITTAQDYYPFGMLMPSRIGYQTENGWTNEPGDGGSGGDVVPENIAIDSRVNNAPPEYTATNSIELNPGFQSGSGDAFLAYISEAEQGSGGSSGNNSSLSNGYYRYGFNGKENDNEVKGTGNQLDFEARIYDSRIGRFLSTDPLTKEFPWQSPYTAFDNNPIIKIDPDGRSAVPYDEFDKNGKKISNLGGDKIDFFHQSNGDTKIVDKESGASNTIVGGEQIIRNYTLRNKDISWARITYEWDQGVGPTRSMIADFDNSTTGAFGSLNSAFSNYSSAAREASLNSTNQKDFVNMTYDNANPFVARDMWEQMWGRARINWYKLGNITLFLMTDSKSMTSAGYRVLPSWDRSSFKLNGNTYQTYIWTETNSEIRAKVNEKANYIHQQFEKILRESRYPTGPKF